MGRVAMGWVVFRFLSRRAGFGALLYEVRFGFLAVLRLFRQLTRADEGRLRVTALKLAVAKLLAGEVPPGGRDPFWADWRMVELMVGLRSRSSLVTPYVGWWMGRGWSGKGDCASVPDGVRGLLWG
jgi:hypothetical protein